MQALLLTIAAALAAQLGSGDRYSAATPPTPAGPEDSARQAFADAPQPEAASPDGARSIVTPQPTPAVEGYERLREPRSAPPPATADSSPMPDTASEQVNPRAAAPASPPNLPAASLTPDDLTKTMMKAPAGIQISGIPISLIEAMNGAGTRAEQTQVANGYWALSTATAEYYLAAVELEELQSLYRGVTSPGAIWETAIRQQERRLELTRQSLRADQLQLQQMLGRRTSSALPLPADLPHSGRYDTRYNQLFAQRRDPAAEQLHRLLPLGYAELTTQAQAVAEARDWLALVSERRTPGTDGTGLLRAHDLLSLRRRAYLDGLRDYNQRIAAYTERAAPGPVESSRLVAMLIKTSGGAKQIGWSEPNLQRASAYENASTAESDEQGSPRRRTFAEQPRRIQARRPILNRLGFRDREHSILLRSSRRSGK